MVATGETCEDPWISVKTRLRFPPPLVISRIENILRARWGISVGELQKVPQQMRQYRLFSSNIYHIQSNHL